MKILGSSKIDDYSKLTLEGPVLKAIDAKPGDSVLFYRDYNDDRVGLYRTEGARITTEADAPRRRHMREAYVKVRLMLMIAATLTLIRLIVTVFNYDLLGTVRFAETFILGILTFTFVLASVFVTEIIDKPYDPQSLVTVGNTFTKNRLTGMSKISSDGFVATGNLYTNALFGANPQSVEVLVTPDGGEQFKAVVTEVRSVPGYSVHKVHIKEGVNTSGEFVVVATYKYINKHIVVNSHYRIDTVEKGKDLKLTEGPVDASIVFDQLNDKEFDEEWLNAQMD